MYLSIPFFPFPTLFFYFLNFFWFSGSLCKLNELCITDWNLLDFVYVDPSPLFLKVLHSSVGEALGVSGDFVWVHGKILCIYLKKKSQDALTI